MTPTWAQYYELAKLVYRQQVMKGTNNGNHKTDLYNLGVEISVPNEKNSYFQLSNRYLEVIDSLSDKIQNAFRNGSNFENRGIGHLLRDAWSHNIQNELYEFGDMIAPQIERYLFNSYAHFDNVRFYKSNSDFKGDATSSWKWHFDNNPKEQIRILVYLNDVLNEGDGQFEYYFDPNQGIVPKICSTRIDYKNFQLDGKEQECELKFKQDYDIHQKYILGDRFTEEFMKDCKDVGMIEKKAFGKKGTLLLFDNNIIHRASPAKNKSRYVMVISLKPSTSKIIPPINPITTNNGWQGTVFNVDPSILNALKRHIPQNKIEQQLASARSKLDPWYGTLVDLRSQFK